MAKSVGEVTAKGRKQKFAEALQAALDNAPPPKKSDIQHFKLLSVDLEFGGFAGSTRTRVTLDVKDGPLK
jgi:hypothetical protein